MLVPDTVLSAPYEVGNGFPEPSMGWQDLRNDRLQSWEFPWPAQSPSYYIFLRYITT